MTGRPSHRHFYFPSVFERLEEIVDETESFVRAVTDDDDFVYRLVLLASEAVTNAIEHGNSHDPAKSVKVDFWSRGDQIEIWVEDEGEGFERESIPDPLEGEQLLADGGRGVFLIERLSDEVRYENGGRRIGMLFQLPTP